MEIRSHEGVAAVSGYGLQFLTATCPTSIIPGQTVAERTSQFVQFRVMPEPNVPALILVKEHGDLVLIHCTWISDGKLQCHDDPRSPRLMAADPKMHWQLYPDRLEVRTVVGGKKRCYTTNKGLTRKGPDETVQVVEVEAGDLLEYMLGKITDSTLMRRRRAQEKRAEQLAFAEGVIEGYARQVLELEEQLLAWETCDSLSEAMSLLRYAAQLFERLEEMQRGVLRRRPLLPAGILTSVIRARGQINLLVQKINQEQARQ